MALLEDLGFSITADLGPFKKGMKQLGVETSKAASGMVKNLGGVADKLDRMLTKVGLVGGLLGGVAVKSAMDYETAMARARTMTDLTADEWKTLDENVRSLVSEFGIQDFAVAGEAVFQAFSTGADGVADATDRIRTSFKNYVAQGTDVGVTLGFIAQQQRLFGEEAGTTTGILDRLANATIRAQSDQERMARSLADTGQLAKAAGLSADEHAGTLATLTQSFGSAERAGTAYKGLLNAILTPTQAQREILDEVNAAIVQQLGDVDAAVAVWGSQEAALRANNLQLVDFGESAVQAAGGFFPFIDGLSSRLLGADVNIRRIAESMEGYSALLALTSDNGVQLGEDIEYVTTQTGRLDTQLGYMQDTAGHAWAKAITDLKLFAVELVTGTGFLADMKVILIEGGGALRDLTDRLRTWIETNPEGVQQVKESIVQWGKLFAGLWAGAKAISIGTGLWGLLFGKVGLFKPLLPLVSTLWTATLLPALKLAGGALLALLGPVGLVIAGVAAIGAAVIHFTVGWDAAWDAVVDMASFAAESVGVLWDGLVDTLTSVGGAILDALTYPFRKGAEIVVDLWEGVVGWFSGIGTSLSEFFGFGSSPGIPSAPLLGFNSGGFIPGSSASEGDSKIIAATPGEFVINEPSAKVLGSDFLEEANMAGETGQAPGRSGSTYNFNGLVDIGWVREVLIPMIEHANERSLGPRLPSAL